MDILFIGIGGLIGFASSFGLQLIQNSRANKKEKQLYLLSKYDLLSDMLIRCNELHSKCKTNKSMASELNKLHMEYLLVIRSLQIFWKSKLNCKSSFYEDSRARVYVLGIEYESEEYYELVMKLHKDFTDLLIYVTSNLEEIIKKYK